MKKLDLSKTYKNYFSAPATPELVDIEPANFISICGQGDPSEQPFLDRIAALYPVAYAIKFDQKQHNNDFVVSKLEGQWWFDEFRYPNTTMANSAIEVPRREWKYRLLIRLPDFVTQGDFDRAVKKVYEKKRDPLLSDLEFFTMSEGKCVQMLHVGPFSSESDTLKVMAEFIDNHKLKRNGLHHEIYLSDFRKTAANKLKTILREPVK